MNKGKWTEPKGLWNTVKWTDKYTMGLPGGQEQENGGRKYIWRKNV